MNIFISQRIALRALMRNKARSVLTIIGIIIGIAAVITVIAVGQGATTMIKEQIKSMGNNVLMIFPGSATSGGLHYGAGSRSTLTIKDCEAIARECGSALAVSPMIRVGGPRGQIVYKEKNWRTSVQGIGMDYLTIRSLSMAQGEFFTESDINNAVKNCILGQGVAENLFSEEERENVVGKIIRISNTPFKVVGMLEKKGASAFGQDQDDVILVPWTTASRILQGSSFNNVDHILVSSTSTEMIPKTKKEVTELLRQRHNIMEGAEDDFTIRDMTELTEMVTSTSRLMTILLAIIASISLIVGGIGIMNIMLVSVTERTREIGIRMAIGARAKDILLQFLVESAILSSIGGIFGIILGASAAKIISGFTNWPVSVSLASVIIAVLFSASVGIFFGFWPAWKASRLDPIEALRYE
ncbi:MAG: ABC transporter permease [Planctomycetes bacterium]|nr:ABC transporter permease [Planctomycetota bacterium]